MPTAKDTPQTYPNYTNLGLEEGVFDRLMLAAKAHVNEEYKAGRINAANYGNVFLGITEAAMQNSTQFLLGMLLIDEKRRGQDLDNQKKEYELEVLLPAQYDKLLAEIDLINKEMQKIDKEMEVMDKSIDKMNAEISLMGKQEQKLDKDMDKIDKEIDFMDAKIKTERANTEAGVAEAGSLIGKQISLLTAQRMGFAGDIRSKMAKLEADYAAVYQSVQEIEGATSLNTQATGLMGSAETVASSIMGLS